MRLIVLIDALAAAAPAVARSPSIPAADALELAALDPPAAGSSI